ncbi:protein late bloomer isoform X1 [Drosophila subpulchrella]|uniref:protein late bloomer isoform X1 n=2 Tax=Drosophila subpulchrella TaxID=1486046 RepID=UPI0018A1B3C2|nr:protein late bloomer isoform X1 [Drosophila subpulchrella]
MYCSTRLLRYVLCVISGICALGGCLLIWYGAWLLESLSEEHRIMGLDHGEDLAASLCILLGTVIIVASIFGSVAMAKDSKTLLICYAVLLVLLLIVQFVMVSISYAASRESLPDSLRQGFDDLWDLQHDGNSTLNTYEAWLHCCGRNSAEDYLHLDKMPPPSCCLDQDCSNILGLFMDGCENKFKEYVSGKTANFHTLSWFLILFEFAGSVTTCYLVDSIRNHRDRIRFYN